MISPGLKKGARKSDACHVTIMICRRLFSHTCTRSAARVSRQDRNASSGRVRGERPTWFPILRACFAYPRKGAPNTREPKGKREKKDTICERRGWRIATWPLHGPPFLGGILPAPNLTYPRWDLSVGFTCHELYRYLPYIASAYLPGIPALLFPIPANPSPGVHHPSGPPTRTGHVSQAFPRDEFVSAKVTGEIFRATVT